MSQNNKKFVPFQLGFSEAIVQGQKSQFLRELHPYSEALLNCFINHLAAPAEIELCMRRWWATQGWFWPWEYPECIKE